MTEPTIAIVDPAAHTPEVDCFNQLAKLLPFRLEYHLPVIAGMDSLADLNYAGVIVLGSSTSVHDDEPWQDELWVWLEKQMKNKVPILAICYGHQLVAQRLGGEVKFIDEVEKPKELGLRTIECQPCRLWEDTLTGSVVVSHREIVTKAPPSMTSRAKSAGFDFEILEHNSLPLWTIQAHPEATSTFLKNQSISLDRDSDPFQFGYTLVNHFSEYCLP